ncbi:hypothetical protein [Simiduia agarivorans]|uniref:Fis family transcriptional regulator n=1 Tax=Simiduia agarivorans (strain DSM 21679 / JCM 13881 / BCRC 17597 / SA1) TaxID=1117647 RepID=K4KIQ2_SIMAS|nr:hypothetical protein [Simiduia agarivorans]AFU98906.2 Fis family transcriptional regulator [Simiduia agarivorans SA1 = DSM 21679]
MLNERARRQYLEAMGIQTYMPRLQLPAAPQAAPVDLSFLPAALEADVASPASPPATAAASGESPKASGEVLGELLNTMGAVTKAAQPTVPKPAATPKHKTAAAPALNVSLWQVADLLILADRHPEQALPVNSLLANILVALNRPADTRKPEVIRWPLEGLAAAHAGNAEDYFLPILQARRPADQTSTLLCFGEQISQALCGQDDAGTALTLPGGDSLPTLRLPSLDTLLIQPELKASVWAAIKHLRQ